MRTSKPISTISYNSDEFLKVKLEELVKNHKISDWMFINHKREDDETKDHKHLWLNPNTLIDTMTLQEFLTELNPNDITKPFRCIDFRPSSVDDWILYSIHLEAYLTSKNETRQFHYMPSDIICHDEDTFHENLAHAFRGSQWAQRQQLLSLLTQSQVDTSQMILSGAIPLNMASNLVAFKRLLEQEKYEKMPSLDKIRYIKAITEKKEENYDEQNSSSTYQTE